VDPPNSFAFKQAYHKELCGTHVDLRTGSALKNELFQWLAMKAFLKQIGRASLEKQAELLWSR
jgi:hypothetical protein